MQCRCSAPFFVAQADVVRFASFQLQAGTGRGVLGARVDVIGNDSVAQRLQQGSGVADLGFNVLAAGHHDCNRSAVLLVVNGRAHDAFANRQLVRRFMRETADLVIDRGTPWRAVRSLLAAAVARPRLGLAALRWALALAWRLRHDLVATRAGCTSSRCSPTTSWTPVRWTPNALTPAFSWPSPRTAP